MNAQIKDSILYVLSDEVEENVFEYMTKVDTLGDFKYYAIFKNLKENDNYVLYVGFTAIDRDYYFYAKNTNRFLVVGYRKIPLFFDYDELFATSDNNNIGAFRRGEGFIRRLSILLESDCYSIVFDENGKIIEK
jgi:hypothetical protein